MYIYRHANNCRYKWSDIYSHVNLINHKCKTINKMRLQFHCIMLINSYNRQNTLFKMTKSVELFGIRLVLLQF